MNAGWKMFDDRSWEEPGFCADGGASGGVCELGGREGIRAMVVGEDGEAVLVVERGGVGVRGASGYGDLVVLGG